MRLIWLISFTRGVGAAQTVLAYGLGFKRPAAHGQRPQSYAQPLGLTPTSSSAPKQHVAKRR